MAHRRKAIRTAVIKALKNKTLAGENVFTNQSTPQWDKDLPAILVYSESETATEQNVAPRELKRVLELRIECIARGNDTENADDDKPSVEDILDDLAEQVECELSRDDSLDCTASDIILTGTEFQFEGEGAFPIGSARLRYEVTYYQHVPDTRAKQAGIEDAKTIEADWHVGHDGAPDLTNIEAEDTVELPQA